ncbi:hypothetical protein [Serinibacter salmoneus]|uniref:hypothetical protein n=1 Tax=Serinibacter salmoneus TaxID=556530 RepID=UPI003CCB9B10
MRCTTRARRCWATSASMARHWSSRRAASSRPTRRRSTCCAWSFSDWSLSDSCSSARAVWSLVAVSPVGVVLMSSG